MRVRGFTGASLRDFGRCTQEKNAPEESELACVAGISLRPLSHLHAPLYVWHMARVLSRAVLIPKSVILADPTRFSRMFPGFMSRCTCGGDLCSGRVVTRRLLPPQERPRTPPPGHGNSNAFPSRRGGPLSPRARPRAIFRCVWRYERPSSTSLPMRLSTSSGMPEPAARATRDSREPASMNSIATEIWGRIRGRGGVVGWWWFAWGDWGQRGCVTPRGRVLSERGARHVARHSRTRAGGTERGQEEAKARGGRSARGPRERKQHPGAPGSCLRCSTPRRS